MGSWLGGLVDYNGLWSIRPGNKDQVRNPGSTYTPKLWLMPPFQFGCTFICFIDHSWIFWLCTELGCDGLVFHTYHTISLLFEKMAGYSVHFKVSLSLICSKCYQLFLPALLKNLPIILFILILLPIILILFFLFYCFRYWHPEKHELDMYFAVAIYCLNVADANAYN